MTAPGSRSRGRIIRRWGATAACFAVLLAGLNLSPTIAKAAAEVPVLGGLFQVLTLVDYDKTEVRLRVQSGPGAFSHLSLTQFHYSTGLLVPPPFH